MPPLHLKILPCMFYAGMEVKQYIHQRALLRVQVLHMINMFLQSPKLPVSYQVSAIPISTFSKESIVCLLQKTLATSTTRSSPSRDWHHAGYLQPHSQQSVVAIAYQ